MSKIVLICMTNLQATFRKISKHIGYCQAQKKYLAYSNQLCVNYFNIVLKNTLLHSLVATALSAAAWARTLIFHVPFFER